ncbi:MAG: penicillin-binding protein [Bryobacteraceae bacterium]|nr:penicillin-binding protein [Bryobacteraceae bacterium]
MRKLLITALGLFFALGTPVLHASTRTAPKPRASSTARQAAKKAAPAKAKPAARRAAPAKKPVARTTAAKRRAPAYSPWKTPTFADATLGDVAEGDDPVVRRAAIDALGGLNGSVIVVETRTGRVLTMVNQKTALKSGFTPCSTIKIPVALAALSEGVIDRTTKMRIFQNTSLDMTEALAYSDNSYFANLGKKMGFDKVSYYARLFGLGEKAGLNIEGEEAGTLPDAPPKNGGIGMMCSFGEGINLTPLQLASLLSAIANGGTLYYLQYPRSQQEVESFIPRVKRQLDIQQWIPEIKPGMMGAVAFGTARRAGYQPDAPILGKTGTCTDRNTPTHLGWFGSFNEIEKNQLAVVVLLTGGKPVNGPVASGVAGNVYKRLAEVGYLDEERGFSPVALMSTSSCCAQ